MAGVTTTVALLAHQGGWDEVLLVGGPILVIGVVLWVAKRRVDAAAATLDPDAGSDPGDPTGGAERLDTGTTDRDR